MIEILNRTYLSRFDKLLSNDTQAKVINAIDSGAAVVSTYDPGSGTTAATLDGVDVTGTLWRAALEDDEARALGAAITDVLNRLPDLQKKLVDSLLKNGAGIAAAVDHTRGAAEIFLTGSDGKKVSLAKMAGNLH